MDKSGDIVLMDTPRIQRTLKRMAHEIAELNNLNREVILMGIDYRGYAVAQALAVILDDILQEPVETLQLILKQGSSQGIKENISTITHDNPLFLVVDDVIFSGQTMFKALRQVSEHLNPSEMHTATLIDRGHRRFPIQAEFCGMRLPTKLNEHVKVEVKDMQPTQILLLNKNQKS